MITECDQVQAIKRQLIRDYFQVVYEGQTNDPEELAVRDLLASETASLADTDDIVGFLTHEQDWDKEDLLYLAMSAWKNFSDLSTPPFKKGERSLLDEDGNPTMQLFEFKSWAVTLLFAEPKFDGQLIRGYIKEAEHQDGYAYWDQFPSVQAVVDDFRLYQQVETELAPDE